MEISKVWAHRGASGYAPENTIVSFKKAIEMGAYGVELDVQLSKDGEIVVCHDETINRTSNGLGMIKDYSLAELKKFNFNNKMEQYEFEPIATLEEVYALIAPTNLLINVEFKTSIVFYPEIEEKVLALTKKYKMEDRVVYSSFNHYTLKRIKELKSDALCGLLYEDGIYDVSKYAKEVIGVEALHPAIYGLQYPNFFEDVKKYGLDVRVWTVNKEEDMRFMFEHGVSGFFTNYPDLALKIAEEYVNA